MCFLPYIMGVYLKITWLYNLANDIRVKLAPIFYPIHIISLLFFFFDSPWPFFPLNLLPLWATRPFLQSHFQSFPSDSPVGKKNLFKARIYPPRKKPSNNDQEIYLQIRKEVTSSWTSVKNGHHNYDMFERQKKWEGHNYGSNAVYLALALTKELLKEYYEHYIIICPE